ncbi:putative damage-inducible protein DinB [Rhizobium sp. SG_E_25_P2]|uniref:DinB family protein n=1 Tax=Rhizobium sp. SG_E_25_P2 TaxID=2879942 RepID=UPI0024730461|nr:DinB family protein [Rhizobium sp. SG_E_25_P2]MDH6266786.1 putative damage-inducible protein DinB [Rhizobium sp. SG_E_25_P2]
MIDTFRMFAAYNRWANTTLYNAAAAMSEEERRASTGAFFGSLHATLNHILAADRIWQKRFTGAGDAPTQLDAILYDDFAALRQARAAEDERIIGWIDSLSETDIAGRFTYTPVSSTETVTQKLSGALSHVFNHQTHHRGQCHMMLTSQGKPSLALDLVYFIRSDGKEWM